MESLRGIFPRSQPLPTRDFLKENVMRIRSIQKSRRPKDNSEYTNKYSKPLQIKPRKLSLHENSAKMQRSTNSLTVCSTKAPMNSLRKSMSVMSLSKATQTVDPEEEFFLKNTYIRYPSASTVRSANNTHQQITQTSSRNNLMDSGENPPRYKSHFHDRRDDHCDKMDKHISNYSEYLDKGSISKAKSSILKSSSSLQKLDKNSINETQQNKDRCISGSAHHSRHEAQQNEDRCIRGSAHHSRHEAVVISDDSYDNDSTDDSVNARTHKKVIRIEKDRDTRTENKKRDTDRRKDEEEFGNDAGGDGMLNTKRQQQLEAAANDPNCPDGHVPLSEYERLESLRISEKRTLNILLINVFKLIILLYHF